MARRVLAAARRRVHAREDLHARRVVQRLVADANGELVLPLNIPNNPSLVGRSFYLQAGVRGAQSVATHGLEVVVCP